MKSVTPEGLYLNRRQFLLLSASVGLFPNNVLGSGAVTPQKLVSGYSNYFEFSTNKSAVKHLAKNFSTLPWQLQISGLVKRPLSLSILNIETDFEHVARTYSLRCVEGWSAVIPWSGVMLKDILAAVEPLPTAKYVKFSSVYRPKEMLNQRANTLPWPYTDGLRLDEAMHPLTLLATGMYGKSITKENGAPIRLVVPWKYGYKSVKALQKIELTDTQPTGSWQQKAPQEYGFYANVDPKVAHPRWSQRRELPLGSVKKRATQMFNGYAKDVSSLYADMDLSEHY